MFMFNDQVTNDDLNNAHVVICVGEDGAVIGINSQSPWGILQIAEALHDLSHRLFDVIEETIAEAEKN